MDNTDVMKGDKKITEIKQIFLSNAISDISSYIQLTDTKVSIIMAALVAIIMGIVTCYEFVGELMTYVKPCSWQGIAFVIFAVFFTMDTISVFTFGILTIRSHVSKIGYKSKWFWTQSTKEYSFCEYKEDVLNMSDEDIIVNMIAELYKLNDINRQKQATYKWTLRSFSAFLIIFAVICMLFLLSAF